MTRECQNCKTKFAITADDLKFYEKIKVPPPTWCPECRFLRRMTWRNEWRLFRKKDAHDGKEIFSQYSPDSYIKIYDNQYWYSDSWDPMAYSREYNFERDFFSQFRDLLGAVPLPARAIVNLVNSDYSINSNELKNCYLVAASSYTEDSAYVVWDNKSKNSFDLYMTDSCELCYGSTNLTKSYKSFFSLNCESCSEVIFSRDCVGCTNCFGCANLRNKSYFIFNKPYSKEDYFKKLNELNFGSWRNLSGLSGQVHSVWLKNPIMFMHGRHNYEVTGDYIYESKKARNCYRIKRSEDLKFCQNILNSPTHDCYDYSNWGQGAELVYDSVVCGDQISNIKFCWNSYSGDSNLQYCIFCHNSSNLFGCSGLRNKQYCILNKQYTKEEYKKLVSKIIQHMNEMPYIDKKDRVYKYGEFFPSELSPSEYNITVAQEDFPLTKEEAIEKGYSWKDPEPRNYQIQIPNDKLPDHIKDAPDDIVNQVIECGHKGKCNEQCTEAYKIIPQELAFLRRMNLPLPRLCPNCRHYQRIKQRNPLKLWHRKCNCRGEYGISDLGRLDIKYKNTADHIHHSKTEHCPNEFETTYSPERPEIVYCEQCYLREVV